MTLEDFTKVGFHEYTATVEQYVKDFADVCNSVNVPVFLMFGSLLGYVRQNNILIPWDDDVDLAPVCSYQEFEESIKPLLEKKGYTVITEYVKDQFVEGHYIENERVGWMVWKGGVGVPVLNHYAGSNIHFPWLDIWEYETHGDGLIRFNTEPTIFPLEDIFPIQPITTLDTVLYTPFDPVAVLNRYLKSDDWMTHCKPPIKNHRAGGLTSPTGFAQEKYVLGDVLAYLADPSHSS